MKLREVLAFLIIYYLGVFITGWGSNAVLPLVPTEASWLTWIIIWILPPVVILWLWNKFGRKLEGALP